MASTTTLPLRHLRQNSEPTRNLLVRRDNTPKSSYLFVFDYGTKRQINDHSMLHNSIFPSSPQSSAYKKRTSALIAKANPENCQKTPCCSKAQNTQTLHNEHSSHLHRTSRRTIFYRSIYINKFTLRKI